MNRFTRTIAAAALATAAATAPAAAGGSVSFTYVPSDPQEAQQLQTGLALYGLFKGLQDGSITQNGNGNMAGLAQLGQGNLGVIHQEGNGHNATLDQQGNGNAYGIFQFGENTDAHVGQYGNGQAGITVQAGW